MHEATWLRLMRGAFLACCVLPTLGVLGWIALHASPLQVVRWEHALRQSLGLVARIERVSFPKPGHVRLHGLQLIDPATNQPVADTPQLDAIWNDQRCLLRMAEAGVAAEHSLSAWPIWHDRVLRDEMLDGRSAELRVDRLDLRRGETESQSSGATGDESANPGSTLHAVRWSSWVEQAQRQSRLELHLAPPADLVADSAAPDTPQPATESQAAGETAAGDSVPEDPAAPAGEGSDASDASRVLVTVHRSADEGVPVTHVMLDSGSHAVAPQLLAAQLGMPLADQLKFSGTLRLALEPTQWSGQFKGQVSEIDLGAWSEGRLPYPVDGQARVTLHQCDFGVGGVQRAVGELHVTEGRFDRLLLEALVRNGLAQPGEAFAALPASEPVSQVEMQMQFGLNEMGVVTRGVADEQGREVAARGPSGILLLKSASTRHLDALVRALVYPARPSSEEASQKMWRVAYNIKRLLPSLPELSSARPEAASR